MCVRVTISVWARVLLAWLGRTSNGITLERMRGKGDMGMAYGRHTNTRQNTHTYGIFTRRTDNIESMTERMCARE